jgi:hypothetical protein
MRDVVRKSWEEAMAWAAAGEWRKARERLTQFFPRDPFALLLLEEMANRDAPPPGWDGVLKMKSKT